MGSRKAAVLPVPVAATPMTSRPWSAGGMARAWMGVGRSKWAPFRAFREAGERDSSSNDFTSGASTDTSGAPRETGAPPHGTEPAEPGRSVRDDSVGGAWRWARGRARGGCGDRRRALYSGFRAPAPAFAAAGVTGGPV